MLSIITYIQELIFVIHLRLMRARVRFILFKIEIVCFVFEEGGDVDSYPAVLYTMCTFCMKMFENLLTFSVKSLVVDITQMTLRQVR